MKIRLALLLTCLTAWPGAASAEGLGFAAENAGGQLHGWFVGISLHASLLSDIRGLSNLLPTFGYGVRVGRRWDGLGGFLQLEHNLWWATESKQGLNLGALNAGLGFDAVYANGKVETSVAAGPSILLQSTPLDRAGHTGLFLELRPVGLRWKADEHVGFTFDPLSLAVVAPVLGGIPLIHIQYRTTGGAEILP
ncbi:MAG TPA: hypothetical protein VFZ61_28390 [Polyangiales bacterium]